ncbi:hypothetical protein [uncultured Rhodoblastus sp.]|uniref:hypothetical protein n=1 Tax=uncultured Rhodoblastus sp. TaxID=543037 RepID=UPI0025E009E0|nr:hypothetical protein [uncultured Rhodoblastus sp.]
MAIANHPISRSLVCERPIATPTAPRMENSADLPDRDLKTIDALAMVMAKNLPLQFISEFKRAHDEGVTLVALADAILLAHAKRLSACGRCRDRLCRSCPLATFSSVGLTDKSD